MNRVLSATLAVVCSAVCYYDLYHEDAHPFALIADMDEAAMQVGGARSRLKTGLTRTNCFSSIDPSMNHSPECCVHVRNPHGATSINPQKDLVHPHRNHTWNFRAGIPDFLGR